VGGFPGVKCAIQTGEFTVGTYRISRIVGKPIFPLIYPALDASGRAKVVMFAALDLTWLNQLSANAGMPSGSKLVMVDRNGLIIRTPSITLPQEEPMVREVYFSPIGGCTDAIVRKLDKAQRTVLVQASLQACLN